MAKGLFNVCRMQNTAKDLLLIADCLKAAYPGDDAIIDRLRDKQIAGSALTDQRSTLNAEHSTLNRGTSVLAGIKLEGSPYAAAIQQYTKGTDYSSLVALGNLLLLSDRAKEARPVFERAYALATDKYLATATENVARCIRAEDGTIDRANTWALSIRPSTPTTGNL